MRMSKWIANRGISRRPRVATHLAIALLLTGGVIAGAGVSPGTVRAAGGGKVTAMTSTVIGRFDAAALIPSGPLTAVASVTKFPAGYTHTHHHGGLRLMYLLSGTVEVTDDAGTKTHTAGDFWVEAQGHSHTAHAITDMSYFAIDLLPPGAQATVPEGPASGPTNTQRTILSTFGATGLFPAGPLDGVASLVTFPTGFMQKHYHGGPRFVYQLSGTIQLDEDSGEELHQPGFFFIEPRGHVHTATVIAQASKFVLDFLTPGAEATYPLVAAVPAVTPSGPGVTGSFTATFSSVLPGSGLILFGSGPGCLGLVETATTDSGANTVSHSVTVRGNDMPGTVGDIGILPGATYWFETVTAIRAGVQVDNNDGKCYSVTIPTS